MVNTIGICFFLTQSPYQKFWMAFYALIQRLRLILSYGSAILLQTWESYNISQKMKKEWCRRHTCYLTTSVQKWFTLAHMPLVRTSPVASSKYRGPWLGKCFPETTQHHGRRPCIFGRELAPCYRQWMKTHVSCVDFYPLSCIIVFSLSHCHQI